MNLLERIHHTGSKLEARLIAEYGAIFVTTAVPPPKVVFANEVEVSSFQASVDKLRHAFGDYEIELQTDAMIALKAAARQAADLGISISPRAADSGSRSYEETVKLWHRNVTRGLDHWLATGKLSQEQVESIRNLPTANQVETILNMEDADHIFFSTHFDKSILYSVAAPGASQHLSMLAFDIAEFGNKTAETVMSSNGWYRTVSSDLPHFTYLGHEERSLPGFGLERVVLESDECMYHFWIPNRSLLTGGH